MSGTQKRVFDSHFHIFDLAVRDALPNQNVSMGFPSEEQAAIHRTHTAQEAESSMATVGITEAVFVQCYNDSPEEIDWVLKQFQRKSFVKGFVAGLDPCNHDKLKENLIKFAKVDSPKFVGIRHLIGLEDPDYSVKPEFIQGLQILAEHGLTFDLQSYPDTIHHIPTIAAQVPQLKMVIDHIAKPYYHDQNAFKDWCDKMSKAALCPNVYCKLSGLINEIPEWSAEKFKPYVDHCLKVFGVSRCFYGSDWPVCNLATPSIQYGDVVNLLEALTESFTEAEKEDIFYNNAKKFYNII